MVRVPNFKASSTSILLALVCTLGFVAPYSIRRNIDLQGWLLIAIGVYGWILYLVAYRSQQPRISGWLKLLLGIFITSCLLDIGLHHQVNDLAGSPLLRLGAPGLLACVGIALALRAVPTERLLAWLYGSMLALAISTVAAALLLDNNQRLGGVFYQADILAVFMACGLIIGVWLLGHYQQYRWLFWVGQVGLLFTLIGTQTRAVLLLVLLLAIAYAAVLVHRQTTKKYWYGAMAGGVLLLGIIFATTAHHDQSRSGLSQSSSYRFALQQSGLRASLQVPFTGYGVSSVADALSCPTLQAPALVATCHEGYYFNSSHNIFLDRVLGLGWPGGLAYAGVLVTSLSLAWRRRQTPVVAAGLLITVYYLTNVTNIELELLFWLLLLRPHDLLKRDQHPRNSAP